VARIEYTRSVNNFGGKPIGKRSLWKPIRRWEDNIKICVTQEGCEDKWWN